MTDHRIGVTVNGVDRVLEGETLDNFLVALYEQDEKERLDLFLQTLIKPKSR